MYIGCKRTSRSIVNRLLVEGRVKESGRRRGGPISLLNAPAAEIRVHVSEPLQLPLNYDSTDGRGAGGSRQQHHHHSAEGAILVENEEGERLARCRLSVRYRGDYRTKRRSSCSCG